ncbi:MAG TPA: hypothetical protein DCY13_06465 [Verrucomicrobiales bacterium]|nr:hypothetical protein [Verrucomicrobiales bacterium]
MNLKHGLHLAYCTNVHRGETWAQTLETLERYTLRVRDRVSPGKPFAIGLRLGAQTARELADIDTLNSFRRWLDGNGCYVFTINGFPHGRFHGGRVKEQVYLPDWTSAERVDYTNLLFDLLAQLVPEGVEGSVSTVPGSYKEFVTKPEQETAMRRNLWQTVEHVAGLEKRTGKRLHLGLEPEPLCYLETSEEMVRFHGELKADRPGDERLARHLGVNYDTCHLAIEFENPHDVIRRYREANVLISKLHFSNALRARPTPEALAALKAFDDIVYFHQVISRSIDGGIRRFKDLDVALAAAAVNAPQPTDEWRIHFHIPLHCEPTALYGNTADHLQGVLDELASDSGLCSHLEMETYTWEVMPGDMKREIVEQLAGEYDWTLRELKQRSLA